MSFTLMAKTMSLNVGSLAKKMVLIKLADQANDHGSCWPSYQTIAEACQVSRRTVIRHIKSLEEDGYLTITKTYDKANKKNFSNRYQLTLDRGVSLALVTESHHPSDNVSISGDRESPKPINKPINEPIKKKGGKEEKFKPVKPESVSEQTWNDLLTLRRTKRAVESQTAWNTIFNALEKTQQATGHSLEQIIIEWVSADWKGFKLAWYMNRTKPTNTTKGLSYDNQQPKPSKYESHKLSVQQQLQQQFEAEDAQQRVNHPDCRDVYTVDGEIWQSDESRGLGYRND